MPQSDSIVAASRSTRPTGVQKRHDDTALGGVVHDLDIDLGAARVGQDLEALRRIGQVIEGLSSLTRGSVKKPVMAER